MSTPSPTGPGPGIVQQVKDDMARSEATARARATAFEQKQVGWLRANAPALLIGFCVGAVLSGALAHALHL